MQQGVTQKRIIRYLQSGCVHPSLLLLGPDPEVKFKTAILIANFLLCQSHKNGLACGTCSVCRRIEKGVYPDLLVFGHAEDAGEEDGQLKVDLVREITHHMEVSALEGGKKVCVVDSFERMNVPAQNAFLKTLEEPGVDRYFILLSSQKGTILPTIRSRCLEFAFKPEVEAPVLDVELKERYLEILKSMFAAHSVYGVTKELKEKEDVLRFLQYLQYELRAQQLAKAGIGQAAALFKNQSEHALSLLFENTVTFEGKLRSNASHTLMLETFLRENILEARG